MWNGAFMAKTKSNIKAICDAGPVIHLDELNCLDLLCDFQEIILADTVWEEVKHHRPTALKNTDIPFVRSAREHPKDELLRTMCRIFSLDAGEAEALKTLSEIPTKSSLYIKHSLLEEIIVKIKKEFHL
jgi:predicted nucleic acid-binding protein